MKTKENHIYYLFFVFLLLFSLGFSNFENNKAIGQTSSSGQISSSSSSSGGIVLSNDFSAIWSAKVQRTVSINGIVVKEGTRPIKLKLCTKDGLIRGVVVHPGFFTRALIINQNTISQNEVEVGLKDRKGRTSTLRLKLIGDFQLDGSFSNGVDFTAKKLTEFRLCDVFRRCDINELFPRNGFKE